MEVTADFLLFSSVPAGCPLWLTMELQRVKEISRRFLLEKREDIQLFALGFTTGGQQS